MKRAFSLIELMIVMLIFTFLFGGILVILTTQNRAWNTGFKKLTEQQEAIKAMHNNISKLLRGSNPDWVSNGVHYPVSISESGSRIDFYQPVFDASGEISFLRKITFKLDPSDNSRLLRKTADQPAQVVANDVESVSFGGGCAGCSAFNCSSVASDCPVVVIGVKTKKETEFSLASQITLRNTNITLSDEVIVEEPEEGEF